VSQSSDFGEFRAINVVHVDINGWNLVFEGSTVEIHLRRHRNIWKISMYSIILLAFPYQLLKPY